MGIQPSISRFKASWLASWRSSGKNRHAVNLSEVEPDLPIAPSSVTSFLNCKANGEEASLRILQLQWTPTKFLLSDVLAHFNSNTSFTQTSSAFVGYHFVISIIIETLICEHPLSVSLSASRSPLEQHQHGQSTGPTNGKPTTLALEALTSTYHAF